jgi:hypothetical protein
LEHSGSLREQQAKGGRKWKSRKKELLNVCHDLCLGTNGEVPKAKHVQAAEAKHYSVAVLCEDTAYKAVVKTTRIREIPDDASFQLIAPYLAEFSKVNPGSKVDIVYNDDKSLKSVLYAQVRVCLPSCMLSNYSNIVLIFICINSDNGKLYYVYTSCNVVRCVSSKSQWKGTLYDASVLTGMDNIYPVAFAVTESNEDFSGWQRFLSNLKECLQCFSTVPPGKQRPKFSFVSNRDKGLEGALEEELKKNHSFKCAVHIQRNVLKYYGK